MDFISKAAEGEAESQRVRAAAWPAWESAVVYLVRMVVAL